MLIPTENPDDFVTEVKTERCEYHKRQPWAVAWAGCTCSSGISRRRATPEERALNVQRREEEERRREQHMRDYDAGRLGGDAGGA